MKKVLLLSISLLAMLMADFTLEGEVLTPVSETTTPVTDPTPPTTSDPVNTSGIIPNSVDLIWEDTFGNNTGCETAPCGTSATSTSLGQAEGGDRPNYPGIGSTFRIPTANMWNEVELEGDGSSCSHSINQAVNTRVEIGVYRGWWLDANGKWHPMTEASKRGGSPHPPPSTGLVGGERGCYQQYFYDERAKFDKTKIIKPYNTDYTTPFNEHVYIKPQNYYRWHGWGGGKTIFDTDFAAKAIFIQQYARLVKDNPDGPDDRHLARYVIHMGADRKEKDGTQLWHIGISRYKRVTKDWQPFNLFMGPQSKAQLEANPPPFMSVP